MAEAHPVQDARETIEAQLTELKKEIGRLSKTLQDRASGAADEAEDVLDSVRSTANGAAKTFRRQARVVSDAIGENPGTAATVLSSAGVMGILIGLAAGYVLAGGLKR